LALVLAWLVHAYTASGAVLAFLAARDVIDHRYRDAFVWLFLQVVVDSTDGVFARMARVSEHLRWFSGPTLDDLVDYLAYVFVPALFVWRALLVPDAWALPVASLMLVTSCFGFSRRDAKTADHLFTGFPSYWNVLVFYLFVAGLPAWVNAVVLVVFAALVLVPIRYVYPSRTQCLRPLTLALGAIWAALMLTMMWQLPAVSQVVFWVSMVFPAYYAALSLVLTARRATMKPSSTVTE